MVRKWSNDNISQFLDDDGRKKIVDNTTKAFEGVLDALQIDWRSDPNAMDTPSRMAKMYVNEIMSGRYYPRPDVTAFPNDTDVKYDGMLVIRAEITSLCSHHHQPVNGIAYIGIIPEDNVIGLSKYIRLAQWCASRGTLQEELCNMIASEIQMAAKSENVGVYIQATHGCCQNRGVKAHSSLTQTTVLHGSFKQPDVKKEFFDNINLQQQFAPR